MPGIFNVSDFRYQNPSQVTGFCRIDRSVPVVGIYSDLFSVGIYSEISCSLAFFVKNTSFLEVLSVIFELPARFYTGYRWCLKFSEINYTLVLKKNDL